MYPVLHEQFVQSLKDLIPKDHQQSYFEHPNTAAQSESSDWHTLRQLFVTASVAKRAIKLIDIGAKNFLKSNLWGIGKDEEEEDYPAMVYGRENESTARNAYKEKMQAVIPSAKINLLGLCQSVKYPQLACSPDSTLEMNTLITANEIKCPFRLQNIDPEFFDSYLTKKQLKDFYLFRDEQGKIQLKEDHMYYFQVQMVMGILGLPMCDLIVWLPKGMAIVPVHYDEEFWEELALGLTEFHNSLIIPEYFLQRTPRDLDPIIIDISYT
ncbi:uncharacterized protein LOC127751108 [Frankliniella occidentalis]|uniref:Uncharacterized protein LOC127751108 n=1 Tax=Frankliniella occidentalis TaxID=133901 RepID=A0A9C6X6U4_FRAOC|nr:uncharacterized protein LOC127751108 [Frankliniella occidentalis]